MKDFDWILHRAQELKGQEDLTEYLPAIKTSDELKAITMDRYLSMMGLRIFRAGLKHSVVDNKWPNFEKVFHDFDVPYVAHLSDEQLEEHMLQPGLIKHWGKMKGLRHNATWMIGLQAEQEGFASYIAEWPVESIVELWLDMKKKGSQMGGRSAQAFLRMVGKDTFMLTQDVMVQLRAQGISDKVDAPTAKRDLAIIQDAFNQWHEQSQWPMAHISRLLSFTK